MTKSMSDQSYGGIWTFSDVSLVCAHVMYVC